jgi:hypothetical protein
MKTFSLRLLIWSALGAALLLPAARALAADYIINVANGGISVVNNSGNPDNLMVSDAGSSGIKFMVQGATFQVNGTTTQDSATVPLSGNPSITSIIINCGSNGQFVSIGAFSGTSFPSLTINGGAGNDTVDFNGSIIFGSGNSLRANLQSGSGSTAGGVDNINVVGAHLTASGSGTIDLECSQRVYIYNGAKVTADVGGVTLSANQQTTATSGNFSGVTLDGAGTVVQTTGSGDVTVTGTGGDDSGGFQPGVSVTGGAQLLSANNINVTGTGGVSKGIENRGVLVYGAGSAISSASTTVTGTAGAKGSGYGIGVSVLDGGLISSSHNTKVTGTGNGLGDNNEGVELGDDSSSTAPSKITADNGSLNITAVAGPGNSLGLILYAAAEIFDGADHNIPLAMIYADSVSIQDTASIGAMYFVQFFTISATTIDLGGDNAAGTLGFPAAEMARLKGNIEFHSTQGSIVISQPLTFPGSILLVPNSTLKAVATGIDLNLSGHTLGLESGSLSMPIMGTVADTNYPQLHVSGNVSLDSVGLDLTGTTYAGNVGDMFTVVKVDGGTLTGTFKDHPEGSTYPWPVPNSSLNAQITYKGGTSGHDVVLTLQSTGAASTTTTVTSSMNPSVAGQDVMFTATVSPAPGGTGVPTGTVVFDFGDGSAPATISLSSGVAQVTHSFTSVGTYTITGAYSGDSDFNKSSDTLSQMVNTSSGLPAHPLNISTRMEVQGADNVLIAGFIVSGPQGSSKKVMIRGLGPSLANAGVTNPLADPLLELHLPDGTVITNDDWQQASNSGDIPNGFQPADPRESVIIATLPIGSGGSSDFTAILKGAHGETGIGLAEAYDLDQSAPNQFANISTRGFIDTGDNVMIGGFILGGSSQGSSVLIHGIGPSLANFGVTNALADPTLALHDSNGATIKTNDDWKVDDTSGQSQEAAIRATTLPPSNDAESAILVTLPPGAYTAIVAGKSNTTGVGLVEVYNLQ